jgi:hypothetical protein
MTTDPPAGLPPWHPERPWSPLEEADIRRGWAEHPERFSYMAGRWIATLDAARAASQPGEAGLRERIHAALNADGLLPDCSGTHTLGYAYCQRLAAALAAPSPVASEAGLREALIDLPTLAEAIRLWYVKTGRNPVTKNWDQPQAGWLIAEYVRLRAATSTDSQPEAES